MASNKGKTFRYVNDLLNIAYITGFVRKPTSEGFLVQQTNNIEMAVPIELPAGFAPPKEYTPITVVAHVFGRRTEQGEPEAYLRAIDTMTPSSRAMPLWLSWNTTLPKGATEDDFKPFGKDGTLDKSLDGDNGDTVDSDDNRAGIVREILELTKGRLDTRLGDNANTVMLAGFLQGAALIRGDEKKSPYLALLLRQHGDASKSIPVRIHERSDGLLKSHLKSIQLGAPLMATGQVRVKVIPDDDGNIVKRTVYIRASGVSGAQQGVHMLSIPAWLKQMLLELKQRVEDRRMKALEAKRAAAGAQAETYQLVED